MKTRDAFAFGNFDAKRILSRLDLGDFDLPVYEHAGRYNVYHFAASNDEEIVDVYKIEAQNCFNLDDFAAGQQELNNLRYLIEHLKGYEQKIKQHCGRLEKYFQQLNSKICSDETLSADVIRQKTRRIKDLQERYLSACRATENLKQSIEEFISEIETENALHNKIILAERLRQARKEMGLTQSQVAAKIGMTQGGYTQYENAINEPSTQNLAFLSKILKRPTDWLLGLTDA